MLELTREEKLELVEKLPQRLQDFLYSEDTGAFLLYIGEKYSIPDEKISLLSKLVGDVILGITPLTALAQEINSKVTQDPQASMLLAQELYSELLAPVLKPTPAPAVPTAPLMPVAPIPSTAPKTLPAPLYQGGDKGGVVSPSPIIDRYRESVGGAPEIVDLRKTPPPQIPVPVSPAPIPPLPRRSPDEGGPKPLTFTKPVERTSLIEAEPHKKDLLESQPRETWEGKPQFIIRPPGLAPTDAPKNILDLRRDKGEF